MAEKPIIFSTEMVKAIMDGRKTQTRRVIKPQPGEHPDDDGYVTSILNRCPYDIEDILWVRETWAEEDIFIMYRADLKDWGHLPNIKWRPSIHMPRQAARLFLIVKDIRVERLQDITEEDARAEGVKGIPRSRELYPIDDYIYPFKRLWDSFNAKRGYGWDTNPWVWVISFERIARSG